MSGNPKACRSIVVTKSYAVEKLVAAVSGLRRVSL